MTMDNGMDVQDNAWAQLGRQLAAKDRIIRDLIDERDDYKACAENWEANATKWSDDWHELRDERDALSAHVERLNSVVFDTLTAIDDGNLEDAPFDLARDVFNEAPTTSLAHLKAKWQADALEDLAQANSRDLIHPQIVMDLAAELRRQSQEAP